MERRAQERLCSSTRRRAPDGTTAAGVGLERNGMGSAVGDYDGDGLLDWFVDSISCPDRTFADTTLEAGVARGWWASSSERGYCTEVESKQCLTNARRRSARVPEKWQHPSSSPLR